MLRRRLWRRLALFDQRFAPAFYEDTDAAFAARAVGLRVVIQPSATVHHTAHTTLSDRDARETLLSRNRRRFAAKWRGALASALPPCATLDACDRANGGIRVESRHD